MTYGAIFLKFTYYLICFRIRLCIADLINTVYALCPYAFNGTLPDSILDWVVVFVFLPSILKILFNAFGTKICDRFNKQSKYHVFSARYSELRIEQFAQSEAEVFMCSKNFVLG